MLQQSSGNKKVPVVVANSVIETMRDVSSGVAKTVVKDVIGKIATDALTTIFSSTPNSGELRPNEAISLTAKETQPKVAAARIESARRPYVRVEESDLKQKIDAVRGELKALAAAIKTLNQDVQKAIAEVPVDPGIYHLNFLDRIRGMMKILREQIEDSRSWLSLSTQRKKKKGYWGMYKKHGTKFGLSSERSPSTAGA